MKRPSKSSTTDDDALGTLEIVEATGDGNRQISKT